MSDRGANPQPDSPAWLARVRMPETAGDWQLIDSEPGAEEAARDLTSALREAAQLIDQAIEGVDKRLTRHRDLGARDTEPRYVARHALSEIIERALAARL